LGGVLIVLLVLVLALHKNTEIQADIWIERPPADVWRILVATNEYPSWNPFLDTCVENSIPAAKSRSKSRHLIPAP
jgi:hypothetical protein